MKKKLGVVLALAVMALPLAGCEETCGRKDIKRYNHDGSVDKCVTSHDDPQPHWSQIKKPR